MPWRADCRAQLSSGEGPRKGSREALFQTALVPEALHTPESVPRSWGDYWLKLQKPLPLFPSLHSKLDPSLHSPASPATLSSCQTHSAASSVPLHTRAFSSAYNTFHACFHLLHLLIPTSDSGSAETSPPSAGLPRPRMEQVLLYAPPVSRVTRNTASISVR